MQWACLLPSWVNGLYFLNIFWTLILFSRKYQHSWLFADTVLLLSSSVTMSGPIRSNRFLWLVLLDQKRARMLLSSSLAARGWVRTGSSSKCCLVWDRHKKRVLNPTMAFRGHFTESNPLGSHGCFWSAARLMEDGRFQELSLPPLQMKVPMNPDSGADCENSLKFKETFI